MTIKNTTKLGALLEEYPPLKMSITAILPDFAFLEQPHLRDTVLSITTVEHLAQKSGREVAGLVADLSSLVGIQSDQETKVETLQFKPDDPDWIKQKPRHVVDGVELLTTGEHPLSVIQDLLKDLSPGETILLTTNFPPQPMIEAMEEAGADTYSRNNMTDSNLFLTFIKQ